MSMETAEGKTSNLEALSMNIEESGGTRNNRIHPESGPVSAHTIDHDSWLQVGLMLVTTFSSSLLLSLSSLILVPVGWAWGIALMLIVGFFSAYANWLLAGFHFIQEKRFIRYKDLMGFLFGKQMYYATWVFQFSTLDLTNISFILLGAKGLKELGLAFGESTLRLQYFIVITGVAYFIFAVVVPNMSSMRLWLGVSALLALGYIGALLVQLIKDGKANKNRDYEAGGSTVDKVFNIFCVISAIVACNTTGMLPEIQSTLRQPAVKNMRKALYLQYTMGAFVYYGVTIMGYWAYGSNTPDYLTKQISGPRWVKVFINSFSFLQNVISQHMFAQPIYEVLDTKFLKSEESVCSRENFKRRFILRALVLTVNTFVAAALPFIGDFINLVGSFILVPLTFVFPSMIFIKVKGRTANAVKKTWHWSFIFVSVLVAIATTISAIRLIVNDVSTYSLFADT
ncbi:hypothetical protein Ancab_016802 [Ancistrocladus abbreviatus]